MIEGQGDTQIEAVEKQGEKQLATLNGVDLYVNKKKSIKNKKKFLMIFIIKDLIK